MFLNKIFLNGILILTTLSVYSTPFNSPLPVIESAIGVNSKNSILDQLGRWSIVKYCKLKGLNSTRNVSKIESHRNPQAIYQTLTLLYDFATVSGPEHTYWRQNDAFTKEIINGRGTDYLCAAYLAGIGKDSSFFIQQMRYQASAKVWPPKMKTWYFAIHENACLLRDSNLSQFILGSFNAVLTPVGLDSVHFYLYNRMSRKSLFIGIGPRVKRPKMLGTTWQHINFTLSVDELAKKATKRKDHQKILLMAFQ